MEPGTEKARIVAPDPRHPSLPDVSADTEDKVNWERFKLRIDTYKWRADEYRVRYEGLRTLEWNTILQIYAGYTAIALAFKFLHGSRYMGSHTLAWIAVIATSAFYAATRYLNYRIQERLICFGQTLENYGNKVGVLLDIDPPRPGTAALGHPYYWTYDTQLILSTITFAGLIGYELWDVLPKTASTAAVVVISTIILCILGVRYTPTPRQELVWYASYGSNLRYERFMCYIEGGTPEGRSEPNEGCRDKNPPPESRPISLDFELYFAGKFKSWGEGGAAFIRDGQKSSTLGRMYLITYEQFNDVVMQENSKAVDGSLYVPPFQQLVRERVSLLRDNPWYGKLLNIGKKNGHPILTFTTRRTDLQPNPNRPSEQYVRTIGLGLKETYPEKTDDEIAQYLAGAEGIRGNIDIGQIANWMEETSRRSS